MARTLTRTQVCAALGISPKTLYLWEKAGAIRAPRRDRRGWRAYGPAEVEALRRYLSGGTTSRSGAAPAAAAAAGAVPAPSGGLEGLSARNQLRGTVIEVSGDGVLSEVTLRLGDGQEITAVVTRRSAERLGVRRGREVTAVVKSTEVMLFR